MEESGLTGRAEDDSQTPGGALNLAETVRDKFGLSRTDVRAYSPLTLAFIGDSVYDLLIKTMVVERANQAANRLHKMTSGLVRAGTQAKMAEALWDKLTGEEQAVWKRGRNAKSYTSAKNASIEEYRKATGLEALFGYLYLQDKLDRVMELLQEGLRLTGRETAARKRPDGKKNWREPEDKP